MEKSLNEKVLTKVDDIVSYIQNSSNYQKFKQIEKKMQKNEEIVQKIERIKSLQKQMVKLEVEKKDISKLQKEVDEILRELNAIPIYQEYNYLLEDLNNTFQEIKTIIENYINDKLA